MKTDDKDREGGDSHGAIGAKLMEYALKVRKVFVTGGVDEKMAKDVVQQLHILASISDDPIYMFVNSPGGHVESGDMIFDAIRFITPFSGVDLLRELARRRGRGADLMPVVFTSGIGSVQRLLGDGEAPRAPRYMISQTPQVWLDCQVTDQFGGLEIGWDVRLETKLHRGA